MGNKIRVFSGKSGLIYKTASAGGFVIDSRLVEIGDFNGDGRTDLAMQIAPPAGFGGGLLLRVVDPAADVPLFSLGLGAGTHSIAPLNDLNGDGSSELVVSRPGNLDQLVAFSHVGVPAGSTSFGVGCQGSQSSLPTIRAVGGGPYSQGNSAFGVRLLGAIPGSPALLLTGASFLSWQGAPLPLDLGFLGMSGCSLYVAPDSIKAALVSSGPLLTGTATIALPVPADPALLDTVLNLQWFVFDAGTPLGVMSNAMQLLVL
jgi:hypothetical protein